jgi:hypothetical protein
VALHFLPKALGPGQRGGGLKYLPPPFQMMGGAANGG